MSCAAWTRRSTPSPSSGRPSAAPVNVHLARSHRVAAVYDSHDLAVVAELADHVAVMYAGRIVELSERVALSLAAASRYRDQLSGGERQRVAIALRVETGLSMLFITHNLALIRTIADRVLVMTQGRIVETGAVIEVFEAPSAEYTRQLLANTPSIEAALGEAAVPSE
jgi:ABC-type dipeptide/oligopeptide/nickel transport system ATPase component